MALIPPATDFLTFCFPSNPGTTDFRVLVHYLVRHLQWRPSFDEDSVLSPDSCSHHYSCRGCQPQRAGAGDGQNRDGRLEGEADDNFRFGDVLVVALHRCWKLEICGICLCIGKWNYPKSHIPESSPSLRQSWQNLQKSKPPALAGTRK